MNRLDNLPLIDPRAVARIVDYLQPVLTVYRGRFAQEALTLKVAGESVVATVNLQGGLSETVTVDARRFGLRRVRGRLRYDEGMG